METKFNVDIHKKGEYATDILNMIANHNGGKVRIDLDVICGWLMGKKAMYPNDKLFIKTEGQNGQTISLSEDGGETFYMTITEQEKNDYPIAEHCTISTEGNFCDHCKGSIEPTGTIHFYGEKPVHKHCYKVKLILDKSDEHFD